MLEKDSTVLMLILHYQDLIYIRCEYQLIDYNCKDKNLLIQIYTCHVSVAIMIYVDGEDNQQKHVSRVILHRIR